MAEERMGKPSKSKSVNHPLNDEAEWLPFQPAPDEHSRNLQSASQMEVGPPQDDVFEVSETFSTPRFTGRWRLRIGLQIRSQIDQLRLAFRTESDAGGMFLWAPVFLGLGCIIYFSLPREPLVLAFPLVSLCCFLFLMKLDLGRAFSTFVLGLGLVAAGVSLGQLRTQIVDTVMLPRTVVGDVKGLVLLAEYRANGSTRYTLNVSKPGTSIKIRGVDKLPKKIRLTARKGSAPARVGQVVSGRARLGPPPGPSFPGAYDFAFQSWFRGIGASGFFLGKPIVSDNANTSSAEAVMWIAESRSAIAELIRDALPGQSGALAAALIVGDRSGIDETTAEALRRSGLAHILAISGLHMALVAITVIYVLRAFFACMPQIALHYPVRKWASLVALVAATFYLLLSGANVSTQRAYIMVAIMLIAVLLDRRAVTMRNVALAAIVVLAFAPEAILSPGFQMSFAAVAALVATYEVTNKHIKWHHHGAGVMAKIRAFVLRDIGGLALTSLVAGLATGLFAAYHFYRVAPFGLVANLMAMPLVSFFVMPFALLGMLAMPFGLEAIPLGIMSYFTQKVVAIASNVGAWEPHGNTGAIPVFVLMTGTASLLVATLFRTRLKLLSIPILAIAVLGMTKRDSNDVYILENGRQIGILINKENQPKLALLKPNADKFSTNIWKKAFTPQLVSNKSRAKRGVSDPPFRCDSTGCGATINGLRIVHLKTTERLQDDCRTADVIVFRYTLANACLDIAEDQRPIIIDGSALQNGGAHSLKVVNQNKVSKKPLVIVSKAFETTRRPWNDHRNNQ